MNRHKIGIDLRMIRHSGIGIRIQNILKFWKNSKNIDWYLFGDPEILKNFSLPASTREIIPYKVPVYSPLEWLGHPRMREMDNLEIPHFNVPLTCIRKCNVTIHDLIPYVMKEYHSSIAKRIYLNVVLNAITRYAGNIIAVSHFTASDLRKHFPDTRPPIHVIPNGIDHGLYSRKPSLELEKFRKHYQLPENFLLMIGIGKGHKNQEFVFRSLENRETHLPLVLAGTSGKIPESLQPYFERKKHKYFLLPFLPLEEMPLLYQSASILIYPSLYEGFGFPAAEAMAMGTLVLSSNRASLPEVIGDGGIYFDPESEESFRRQLQYALSLLEPQNQKQRQEIANKLLQKSREYDWKQTVSLLETLYPV